MTIKPKTKFAEYTIQISGPLILGEDGLPIDSYKPYCYSFYKGLQRFIEAQSKWYNIALQEIKNGKKENHWIWFIFPQMVGLCRSERSKFYGIIDRQEAYNYMNNPILNSNYISCCQAILDSGKTVYEIFGDDACKVHSSIMLMNSVWDDDVIKEVIRKHCWK